VFGAFQALLVVMKGLPLAYNKDMQEDKEPLFDAVQTVSTCVAILPDLLNAMKPRPERMQNALRDGFLLATDLADYLVEKGVPFRDAHHIAGRAVAVGVATGTRLEDMDTATYQRIDPNIGDDVHTSLDVQRTLARRNLVGGPSPVAVRREIGAFRELMDAWRARLGEHAPSALERALHLGTTLPPLQ
jgi:argininosuccinate lyase